MSSFKKRTISIFLVLIVVIAFALPGHASASEDSNKNNTVSSGLSVNGMEKKKGNNTPTPYATKTLEIKGGHFLLTIDSTLNETSVPDPHRTYVIDYLGNFSMEYKSFMNTNAWFFVFLDDQENDVGSEIPLGSGSTITGNIENQFINLLEAEKLKYGTHQLFIMTAPRGDSMYLYVTYDFLSGTFSKADYGTNPTAEDVKTTLKYEDALNGSEIKAEWTVTPPAGSAAVPPFTTEADFLEYFKYDGPNKLANGDYTVKVEVSGTTVNGGDIPDSYKKGDTTVFRVESPDPTVVIDKPENPGKIEVFKKLPGSTYEWKVIDGEGNTMAGLSGSGAVTDASTVLSKDVYKMLAEGDYTVVITETSNKGLVATTEENFSIKNPLTTSVVDNGVNPLTGTGTKNMTDSTVEWYITDENDNEIAGATGTGLTVAETTFKGLPEGNYKLKFKETSSYNGEIHESEAPFTIKNPLTTSKVDRDVNPLSGTGTKNMTDSTVEWYITDENDNAITGATGTGLTVAETTFKDLSEGSYKLKFKETSSYNGEVHESEAPFTIENPLTSAEVDRPVNPKTSTGGQKLSEDQSVVTWVIKNIVTNDEITGTGKNVGIDVFNKLDEGNYTITYTETSNYNGNDDIKSTPFEIKNPLTSANVDRLQDPTSATGGKNLMDDDSTVTWKIIDSNGTVIKTGSGVTVGETAFIDLKEGNYKIEFTETSNYNGKIDIKDTPFSVKEPKTNTHISGAVGLSGTIYNPTQITGSQKQPDSSLGWSIADKTGKVVHSGNGDTISPNILAGLEEGQYTASFLETTTTGKTHKSFGNFVVSLPAPETVIDKPINPETITGTPKNSDWDVTWEIKDSTGKVVISGKGTEVPKSEIDKLSKGDYTVTFTETCPGVSTLTESDSKKFSITPPLSVGIIDNTGGSYYDVANAASFNLNEFVTPKTDASKNIDKATNPQTGDQGIEQNVLILLYVLLGLSTILLVGLLVFRKKVTKK